MMVVMSTEEIVHLQFQAEQLLPKAVAVVVVTVVILLILLEDFLPHTLPLKQEAQVVVVLGIS